MEILIIGWGIAFIVTFYSIPVIMQIAEVKKLYDIPDERKIHKQAIASLGGIGIFAGITMGLLFGVEFAGAHAPFQYFLLAALILFFLGVKDDILVISAHKKFIGQFLAALIVVFKGGLLITNMHGFLGIHELPVTLSYLLSLFTILVTINAFNLIDGVDGLAGLVSTISATLLGIYFAVNNQLAYAVLGFCTAGALLAFLIYNFQPAKIFMGDTGSMLIGLINAVLVIKFIEVAPTATAFPLLPSPALGFGVLLIPLLDTLRVFGMRIMKGKSPFSPDRNHLHHFLLDRGLSHRNVTLTIAAASLGFSALSFYGASLGCNWLIGLQVAAFFTLISGLILTKPRSLMRVVKEKPEAVPVLATVQERPRVKLISIFSGAARKAAPVAIQEPEPLRATQE